jgi:tetratricopeptide (TPR) repeat protein
MAVAMTLPMPRRNPTEGKPALAYALALMPLVLVATLFLLPGARAAWHANLGAVRQSQAELGVYMWPQWLIQDAVRRSHAVDLGLAQMHYAAALAVDAENRTAHLRLGQIALSQGDYVVARQHLETAHRAAPGQRITRQLLGELYAVTGDTEEAVAMWQGGNIDPHKLELRHWWYTHLGATQQATSMNAAILRYKERL